MHSSQALITGGAGDLAKVIQSSLEMAGVQVHSPGKEELDVSSPDSVKAYLSAAGEIDLLVCNAGLTIDKPLARMTESDWTQVMDVNLKGAFLCTREVSRGMMKRRSGHIVFIASFSAVHPPAGQANYAAAKAALLGLILPGFLETKMTEELSKEVKQASLARHTLGRFNTPEMVGNFITFLHQQMAHTSGQVFNLDSRIV